MVDNLIENGLDPNSIPLVMQFNKRDLKDILPVDDLNAKLNIRNVKWYEAIAIQGDGVMESFQEIGRLLLLDIGEKYRVEVTSNREEAKKLKKKKPKYKKQKDLLKELEQVSIKFSHS